MKNNNIDIRGLEQTLHEKQMKVYDLRRRNEHMLLSDHVQASLRHTSKHFQLISWYCNLKNL